MKEINNKEMNSINGGAASYTSAINAIIKAISTLFNIGQAVGSTIRRATGGSYCNI